MNVYSKLKLSLAQTSKARNGYTRKGRKKKAKPITIITMREGKIIKRSTVKKQQPPMPKDKGKRPSCDKDLRTSEVRYPELDN